ncbi:MAG: family 43 glycosylhydrolase, partial [Clostridia bacterium]|nr:family 43 glycosylhydrolase [Clostridia bacterium]
MNKLLKRLLSGAVAAAMVIGTLVLPQFAMAADVDPVISVTFDEGSDAYILENGASLADGRNGKALSLTTEGDQYAQLNYMCIADKNVDDSSVSFKLCGAQNKSITDMRAYAAVYSGSSLKSVASREIKSSDITSDSVSFSIPVTKSEGDTVKLFVWDDMEPVPEGSDTAANFASLNGNYSISVWAKPESNAVWNRIYDLGGGTDNYVFLTVSEGSAPRFAVKHNSEQSVTAGDAVTLNEWHNFVLTRDGNLTSMYIDGFLVSSTSEISFHPSDLGTFTQMYLGKSQWPDPYFKGMIDDFAVYDYALGEDKIHELAAEVYQSKRKQLIYDNNCYILDTKFYDTNGAEIFKLENDENIKIVSNIKNYTGKDGSVTATVYAVAATDDTETAIDGATTTEVLKSLDEKDIVINVASNKIPANTSKLIVKTTTPNGEDTETATTATLYKLANAPVAAPADSDQTTIGAHDPSIVKFGDTYYAYSSHHLIFTSKDLINWKKYDFTNINAKDITPKTYSFISSNYSNTTMNGTYWAPDVIYKEGDAHPYWMYISISCGLGGRNSAISLMKSDNPLFWADSSSDIVDAGVVFATKENSSYVTNAIDANIYTDTSDNNKQYFVWGSFWGGIQAVPLTADGLVQGVDYTSNSTILSSCANVKTTIFSQRGGVAGPEGAWMIEHGDYRYAFTSYGWLGSNYNTRIARAPKTTTFATNTGTQLLDANGTVMGTQHTAGSTSMPSGYKLIGSYRLGDGGYTLSGNDSDGYSIPREAGDAHIYYGPGHNSAINVGDESFYVSHTRKDATEIAATLQVRKMLWTSDGWPVVSPVTYAGEKEQALPEEMLTGTYDLASVGHMKMSGSTIKARNFDLPVVSSKVTLGTDMSMKNASGASIGTWTFDGDHTVTLKFTASGDESKDEYYKSGDTMTMFALYGYDKDEAEPVIALTGTDQNHITQFAKKSAANIYKSTPEAIGETTPIVLAKSTGGNPELGFDTNGTAYAGDPAALVDGDTVYMYVGHDTAENEAYKMPEWLCYSSQNMTDWTYEGVAMRATDISWRSNDTSAWASQCVKYGSKYYLYYCTWDKTASGKQSIGVAVSDSPTGPFTDPLGKPLVSGSFTTPESNSHDDIDPTVLIDTVDGVEHRYLAWGNTRYYVCELNENMTSVKDMDGDNEIVMHKDIKEKKIKSLNGNVYTEAPWLYKRADKYYLFFATNWREEMAYAMTDNPFTGRYDYIQTIMPPTATSNTNHPAVIDFNDKTYFIYHNGALPHGSGFRRSVCIDELKFDENGYVYPVTETSIGLNGTASIIKTSDNKYLGHDAFRNPLGDSSYPLSVSVTVSDAESEYNTAWEIKPAKAVPQGANADNYVSIQSVDKPGLYISVSDGKVTLTQDADGKQGTNMTFKTVEGLDGQTGSVSFESVSEPGKFLTVLNKSVTLSYG